MADKRKIVFKHKWLSPGEEHQETILRTLGIKSPEETGVKKVVIRQEGMTTIITANNGKFWGIAFAQLMITYYDLPVAGIKITEQMKEKCLHCFAGLPTHHGFVSAFLAGETMSIIYNKEEE